MHWSINSLDVRMDDSVPGNTIFGDSSISVLTVPVEISLVCGVDLFDEMEGCVSMSVLSIFSMFVTHTPPLAVTVFASKVSKQSLEAYMASIGELNCESGESKLWFWSWDIV